VRRRRAGKQNSNHARIDLSISNQAPRDPRQFSSDETGRMAGTVALAEIPVSLFVFPSIWVASDISIAGSMIKDQGGCQYVCLWPWQLENLDLDENLALIGGCTSLSASCHPITDLVVR
jgi:hypothetical protein